VTTKPGGVVGSLMVVAAAMSWGTWTLFLRAAGVPGIVSTPIVFATMAIAGLPLIRGEPPPTWDRTTWLLVAANTACDALNVACYFTALDYTTVQVAVLSHYATPILVALAAPWIDRVATPGARPAAAVAMAGLAVVLEPWNAPAEGAVAGAALGLASAAAYAGNVFVVRRLVDRIGAARAMSLHAVGAAVLVLPLVAPRLSEVAPTALGWLVAGGIVPGTIAGVVFARGLARIGSARAAVLTFAEPIVAVGCGVIAWHEQLHPAAAAGAAMILGAGVYASTRPR
jgi:drug/metabolite transporter (DMT)-like permease